MTRGLLLFNLVFLVQNLLDVEYLWAGAALPGGGDLRRVCASRSLSSDRDRADRGRTDASGFQRKMFGTRLETGKSSGLLLAGAECVSWVASSLLRLEKYVSVYSLTGLRIGRCRLDAGCRRRALPHFLQGVAAIRVCAGCSGQMVRRF